MSDIVVPNELLIQNKIFLIREIPVMLDRDLAELYSVTPKRLNEQVKRNSKRFPASFRFQLSEIEKSELVANCDRFNSLKYSTSLPYAFTEQGVSMLSAVLKSDTAIEVSIMIIESFVNMRKFISNNNSLYQRLGILEKKQLTTDTKLNKVLDAIEEKSIKPKQGIFYDGQVFDAYVFVSDLVKGAKKSIILIDNYVDESVLTLFSKNQSIDVTIYSKTISKQLKLDLQKYNAQYKPIELKTFKESHDRFMLIDKDEVYHFGASLKDLGKKWFAFSKFDVGALEMLGRLK